MSNEEFERRINNKLETIIETQANLQEAIAGLIQVARMHDEQIDRNTERITRLEKQVEETNEAVKQTTDNMNALIRIVEGHLSNHP